LSPSKAVNKLLLKNRPYITLMKKQLLLLAFIILSAFEASAQEKLPQQLLRNWLSPKTNEWVFGITGNYVLANSIYWNYKVVSVKNQQYQLALEQKGVKKTLFIKSIDPNTARIGYTANPQGIYSAKINENANFGLVNDAGFQTPLIKAGTIHLQGVLSGYDREQDNYRYINLGHETLIASSQKMDNIELDSLGRFSFDFEMNCPHEVFIRFGNEIAEFYAIPGHSVTLCVDLNRSNKLKTMEDAMTYMNARPKMLFMGQDALLNTAFNDFGYRLRRMSFTKNYEDQKKLDLMAYKTYRLAMMHDMQDTLASYCQTHNPGTKFKQYFEQNIKYQAANELLGFSWNWNNGRKTIKPNYLDFLTSLNFNDELSALTKEYASTLYELSISSYSGDITITAPTIETVLKYIKESGYKLIPEQEEFVKNNITFSVSGADSLLFQFPIDRESEITDSLANALLTGAQKAIDLQKLENRKKLFGLTNGLGADILQAREAYNKINEQNGISAEELESYRAAIHQPELFNELAAKNQELLANAQRALSPKSHLIDHISTPRGDLLEMLIQKYKGKVIYVTFWGPCCMPEGEVLSKEFSGKDVVFLFLSDGYYTDELWRKTIKANSIEGEHYLLNKDEYTLLKNKYEIAGTPHYILINKAGGIVNKNAKSPGERIDLINDIKYLLD
jgi:hypothetical protein